MKKKVLEEGSSDGGDEENMLKNPVAVDVPFVADCERTRQRVIGGSNGVDTSENVDYLYYVGT